jgi:hypothetical protein
MKYKKIIKIDKGIDTILASEQSVSDIEEMLCGNFGAVDGALKTNIKITITIEEVKE